MDRFPIASLLMGLWHGQKLTEPMETNRNAPIVFSWPWLGVSQLKFHQAGMSSGSDFLWLPWNCSVAGWGSFGVSGERKRVDETSMWRKSAWILKKYSYHIIWRKEMNPIFPGWLRPRIPPFVPQQGSLCRAMHHDFPGQLGSGIKSLGTGWEHSTTPSCI